MKERRGGAEARHNLAAAAAEHSKESRVSSIAKRFWKLGINLAAIGGGLLLAAHFLVPLIPLAATNKAAIYNLANGLGKWALGIGAGSAAVGAVKAGVDVATA